MIKWERSIIENTAQPIKCWRATLPVPGQGTLRLVILRQSGRYAWGVCWEENRSRMLGYGQTTSYDVATHDAELAAIDVAISVAPRKRVAFGVSPLTKAPAVVC